MSRDFFAPLGTSFLLRVVLYPLQAAADRGRSQGGWSLDRQGRGYGWTRSGTVQSWNLGAKSGNMDGAVKHWTIAESAGHYNAMHNLLVALKEGYVSRESINSILAAYNKSCAEMRSESRDACINGKLTEFKLCITPTYPSVNVFYASCFTTSNVRVLVPELKLREVV